MTDSLESGPPEDPRLMDRHIRALELLRDMSIQQSSVAYMAGMRITALARMVMERTLDEEAVEEDTRTHLVSALKDKVRGDIDMLSLRKAVTDHLLPFLDDEISRCRSAKSTQELLRNSGHQGFLVKVSEDSPAVSLPRGHLLLLFGSPAQVGYTMGALCNEDWLKYEDGSSVEPESTLLLATQISHGDSSRGTLPLFEWQSKATSPRNWQSLDNLVQSRFNKKFPLLLVSNGNMLGHFPPRANKTQLQETRSALTNLRRIFLQNRQSAIVGVYETAQDPDLAANLEAGLRKHSNVTMIALYEKGNS